MEEEQYNKQLILLYISASQSSNSR